MKLYEIAHSRTGDKGNISTISLIAYKAEYYDLICSQVTEESVLGLFKPLGANKVERYKLPKLNALNFVLHNTLDGGVTKSLMLDIHGKSYSSLMLELEVDNFE